MRMLHSVCTLLFQWIMLVILIWSATCLRANTIMILYRPPPPRHIGKKDCRYQHVLDWMPGINYIYSPLLKALPWILMYALENQWSSSKQFSLARDTRRYATEWKVFSLNVEELFTRLFFRLSVKECDILLDVGKFDYTPSLARRWSLSV